MALCGSGTGVSPVRSLPGPHGRDARAPITVLSTGVKCTPLSFTSDGKTSMPCLRASSIYWLSFAVSPMSLVIMAQ